MVGYNNSSYPELHIRVAWYYYKAEMTQEQIAHQLGINRARVIKILDQCRREGIVSFHVNSPSANCLELEKQVIDRWKLRDAFIVPEIDPSMINKSLGAAGAQYIEMNLGNDETLLGFGWGNTVSLTLKYLSLMDHKTVSLVTLSGGITAYLQNTYREENNPLFKFNSRFHIIPSPLLVSSPSTCRSILDEPEVARIMQMALLANIAVVGIGPMSANATFTQFGYLSPQELEILQKQGGVGDLLGQFYDKDGARLNVDFHNRLIAVSLENLRNMQHVIGIAGGEHKIEAIKGALRGGYLHSLITDEKTALKLVQD
jgi:DNA-binding transcriptional regulator LsrR (DeoR family)